MLELASGPAGIRNHACPSGGHPDRKSRFLGRLPWPEASLHTGGGWEIRLLLQHQIRKKFGSPKEKFRLKSSLGDHFFIYTLVFPLGDPKRTTVLLLKLTKQKQTHRYREATGGRKRGWGCEDEQNR